MERRSWRSRTEEHEMKRLLVLAMTTALTVSIGYANQPNTKVVIPVNRTDAPSGKQMYTGYWAPSHGCGGRGNGSYSPVLKLHPTDLTVLCKNNHGKFPDAHIASVLMNGVEMPAHGSPGMPVWGPILGKMS